jgi:phosphoribosylaminoimidazole carboxylase (NCAIR synthetase)
MYTYPPLTSIRKVWRAWPLNAKRSPPSLKMCRRRRWRNCKQHLPVSPGPSAVQVAQDRALEKAHFVRCGVPVAPHQVLAHADDLPQVPDHLLPGILKTTRMGYDGKGQFRVNTRG